MNPPITPILVDERTAAAALGVSVCWLQRDRRGAQIIPHCKLGGSVRYNLDRCRAAVAAAERGGKGAQHAAR